MDVLTLNQSLGVIAAILALLPVPLLISFYFKIRYFEFLLFALGFITAAMVLITDALVSIFNSLIIIQIHHITIDIVFFILFLHSVRILWVHPPRILYFIGILWFAMLVLLTLFWELMEQPDSAKVLFWDLPHTFSSYFPIGAGLQLEDGTIIYSSAFRYFGEFYRIFVFSILLYSYLKIKILLPTKKIVLARKLWILIWILFLIHSITLFFVSITELVSVFLLISGIIVVYIFIRLPEGLLISQAQVTHALKTYNKIPELKTEEDMVDRTTLSLDSFVKYLESAKEFINSKK